ncbi:MAG: NADH:flavin oxidoreductase/NADH oxidase family protein [Desulfobacteraceae bacterium]|nr:NADH:flavin oxidoreductase/NADH oxidase family protein [Desulfobacteraceae bacterium]
MNQTDIISTPLELARGSVVKNRLFKSAMSEQLGDREHNPEKELVKLYETWAEGGIGISVTGNVMVDRRALGEPGNVVLDEESDLSGFEAWAEAGTRNGTQLWMQLNHPGKQSPSFLTKEPVAPSAVPLTGALKSAFSPPRELAEAEIHGIIAKFAQSAVLAKKTGFSGVQIHCAHGYLLSQFLSPWHNRREDEWGGTPEKRMRFLVAVYRAIREKVGDDYPVGLKMNSADFRNGGFSVEESMNVALAMQEEGIDLIEISGGTYENPSMTGHATGSSDREAYFIEYADAIRKKLTVPLVVTGGFRSGPAMEAALTSGVTDMIGLARPLAVEPDLPNRLMLDPACVSHLKRPGTGIKALDRLAMLDITWYEFQLYRIGQGKKANPDLSAWKAVLQTFWRMGAHAFKQRRVKGN